MSSGGTRSHLQQDWGAGVQLVIIFRLVYYFILYMTAMSMHNCYFIYQIV